MFTAYRIHRTPCVLCRKPATYRLVAETNPNLYYCTRHFQMVYKRARLSIRLDKVETGVCPICLEPLNTHTSNKCPEGK